MIHSLLSVITAVHPTSFCWLSQAGDSLLKQEVPLQWIVVADDYDTAMAAEHMADLPAELRERTTLLATGRPALGAAAARTVALTAVRTPWLSILDADDQWLPGGMDTLLAAAASRNVSWAVGRSDELTSAGRHPYRPENYIPNHFFESGEVLSLVEHGLLPWLPCVMVTKTAAVRAVGGWPPFPVTEDIALAVALGATTAGFAVDQTVLLYRKWGNTQTSERPEYANLRARWRPLGIARAKQFTETRAAQYP